MKLLLTADFHFHKPWFEWVLHVASRYDMICIAGDLLDMFHADGVVPQLIYTYEWMQMLMKLQVPVALCSGNHDLPGNQPILAPGVSIRKDKLPILGEFAKHGSWLHALKMNHLVAVDDDSKIFRTRAEEALTIVCLPYAADGRVRPLSPAAHPCLILHHEPPAQTLVAAPKAGSREFALIVARQQPTWSFSGHDILHKAPRIILPSGSGKHGASTVARFLRPQFCPPNQILSSWTPKTGKPPGSTRSPQKRPQKPRSL